jgi:glycerol kinase
VIRAALAEGRDPRRPTWWPWAITNQRETSLVWDRRTGRPIHNAIVWQDTRTAGIVAELARDGGQDRFRAATGCRWPPTSRVRRSAGSWTMSRAPEARAEAGDLLFGTIDSWLIWNADRRRPAEST